jgi:hypothetical protein
LTTASLLSKALPAVLGKVVVDAATGIILYANPTMEALTLFMGRINMEPLNKS